ncbi:hypothetical protein [Sphingomonas sp. VDB2]|uniref:hypothetical protein n=1 Tax=Sphingomonas sp. VDB2 TaxID=3228751 RepID=UPI003A7F7EB5
MRRAPEHSLLRRFAAALGPGESIAVMRGVALAMICAAGLIVFKLASPLSVTAATILQGA